MSNDQWFMISDEDIDRDVLVRNNIVFVPIEVTIGERGDRSEVRGISFLANELDKIGELFDISGLINRTPTSERNVTLLEQATIAVTENDIHQLGDILSVLKEFALQRGKNIEVSNPHGRVQNLPKRNGNTLHIYFWSVPVRFNTVSYYEVFDYVLDRGQASGTHPSGLGTQIVDEHGRVVAEVHNDSVLYILFDLPHQGIPAGPILKRILTEWDMLYLTPEERIALVAAREAELQQRTIDLYVSAITTRANEHKKAMKDELERVTESINTTRAELVRLLRRQVFLVEQVGSLQIDLTDVQGTIAAEFKQLESLPYVKKVRLHEDILSVYTEVLYSQELEDGTIRELGEYQIKIGLNGESLYVKNLTRTIEGRNHPHDMGNGHLCLGNFADGIAQLVAQYQFYNLTVMMVHFLQNPNLTDGHGLLIYNWPETSLANKEKS